VTTGDLVWSLALPLPLPVPSPLPHPAATVTGVTEGPGGGALVFGGSLAAGGGGFVAAVASATGEFLPLSAPPPLPQPLAAVAVPQWGALNASGPVEHPPAIHGGIGGGSVFMAFATTTGAVYCVDFVTGAELWKVDLPHPVVRSPVVFLASGGGGGGGCAVAVATEDGTLTALGAAAGAAAWTFALGAPQRAAALSLDAAAAATAIVVSATTAGMVHAVASATGSPSWSYNAESGIYAALASDESGARIVSVLCGVFL
jgi:outer membrane protein assembly factor BamB